MVPTWLYTIFAELQKNMSRICTNCESNNPTDAMFCHDCGHQFPSAGTQKITLLDNRYEIRELIKNGSMGSIYKAWDVRLATHVAVKKIVSENLNSEEEKFFQDKFKQEAAILSKLHHEGLPFVIDFFSEEDPESKKQVFYLIMTFIEGKDLEALITERDSMPFPVEEAVDIFLQILEILEYLHSQNPPVIYRDMKPSNVMISNGKVFLVDFGIAKLLSAGKKGTSIGTPGYAAPEQYNGFADERSDIFSLGALMHQLISGKEPNPSNISFERLKKINPDVPDYLDEIIMRMLTLFSDQRPRNIEVIKERFRQKSCEITLNDKAIKAAMLCDRGNALAEKGQYNKAINEYNEAIKIHPGFIRAFINRGSMYYQLKNFDMAIADYNRALQIDFKTAKAYFNRGAAFYAKNMLVNALEDFETAIRLDPADEVARKYRDVVRGELK
jgi:serine/threonine protein kinase